MTTANDATPSAASTDEVPLAVPVQPLEYARPTNTLAYDLRPLAQSMAWLSVMSGLCVAVCFARMVSIELWNVLHPLVFGITIALAVRSGIHMEAAASALPGLRSRARMQLDLIAGIGLCIFAVLPFYFSDVSQTSWGILGIAFLMMAFTTYRHVLVYRALASVAAACYAFGLRRSFQGLGPIKCAYEAVWLCCCGFPLVCSAALSLMRINSNGSWGIYLAIAAFFGCFGYAIIWAWMMSAHFRFVSVVSKDRPDVSAY